jgi:hypothetical protein
MMGTVTFAQQGTKERVIVSIEVGEEPGKRDRLFSVLKRRAWHALAEKLGQSIAQLKVGRNRYMPFLVAGQRFA